MGASRKSSIEEKIMHQGEKERLTSIQLPVDRPIYRKTENEKPLKAIIS
jgi:hypothetical protein